MTDHTEDTPLPLSVYTDSVVVGIDHIRRTVELATYGADVEYPDYYIKLPGSTSLSRVELVSLTGGDFDEDDYAYPQYAFRYPSSDQDILTFSVRIDGRA